MYSVLITPVHSPAIRPLRYFHTGLTRNVGVHSTLVLLQYLKSPYIFTIYDQKDWYQDSKRVLQSRPER